MQVGKSRRAYVVCPVCGHAFGTVHAGTYVTVGREADLCPKIPGRPSDGARAIRNSVTMCPACSFAAGEPFDELDLTLDERHSIEERLREDGLLKVFSKGQPSWLGFHAAEVCGKERSLTSRELGDLCLRASWVCRKEKERPFESTFQLRALRHFLPRRRAQPPPRKPPRGPQLVRERRPHHGRGSPRGMVGSADRPAEQA